MVFCFAKRRQKFLLEETNLFKKHFKQQRAVNLPNQQAYEQWLQLRFDFHLKKIHNKWIY